MKTCPYCGAHGDDPCRTASGAVATLPHAARRRIVRTPGHLETAIREAVDRAYWITPLYAPTVDAATTIGRKIDDAIWVAETKAAGTLFVDHPLGDLESSIVYDVQTLLTVLTALGLTPKGRHDLGIEDQDDADDLAEILEIYSG